MRNQIASLAFLILLCAIHTGCKEDTIIKSNITPSSDFIETNNKIGDTLTIYTKTIVDDSIATKFSTPTGEVIKGLGTLIDPFFGRSNWGIYMQVVPPQATMDLPNADSCVLILPHAGFNWGDTTINNPNRFESFDVYLLTEDMNKDVTYYTKTSFRHEATPIGTVTNVDLWKLKKDSVKVAGANRAPHLRIKLTDAFRDKLNNASKSANTADFLSQIKGVYIRARDTNADVKVVPYFYLTGTADYQRAAIALYYNRENPTNDPDKAEAAFFNFTTNDCAHSNFISRDYSTALRNFIGSPLQSDSLMFMQNEPGVCFDIRIPHIAQLPTGIINKAQLVITLIADYPAANINLTHFTPLPRLLPLGVDPNTGATYTILDRFPTDDTGPLAFIDGNRREVTLPNGKTVTQYYINIPREVQKAIVNKAKELHLRINGTITYPGAYRLIAGGSNHSVYKTRLNIVYTKIN